MDKLFLRQDIIDHLDGNDVYAWVEQLATTAPAEAIYRRKEGRITLRFEIDDRAYFLKLHRGIGWAEIIKNLLQLRLPVLGAENEWCAIEALEQLGVPTMSLAAYGQRNSSPAALHSFVITDDLIGTESLEDFCADWARQPPPRWQRHAVIDALASTSRVLRDAGINHRDYYLCHFHLDPGSLQEGAIARCHLIDLHRAGVRDKTPRRWLIKDLAGLYYSAMDCGLGPRDLVRFLRVYTGGSVRTALAQERVIWSAVRRRSEQLYLRDHGRTPPAPWRWGGRRANGVDTLEQQFAVADIVKDGESSRVARINDWPGGPVFVKHYRVRGLLRRLGFALGMGRPQRCYRVACKLAAVGIAVAVPLPPRLVRATSGLPVGCYYLAQAMPGADLRSLWLAGVTDAESLMQGAGASLAAMHLAGYSHGDCKWSNILFTEDGEPVWLDLDNTRGYTRARGARDLARFAVNAEDLAASRQQLSCFLDAYSAVFGTSIADLEAQIAVPLDKLRERHLHRYGSRGQRLL